MKKQIPIIFAAAHLLVCGCSSVGFSNSGKADAMNTGFVRSVDISDVPELTNFAERARRLANESYPRIQTLLTDDPSQTPQDFAIVFKKQLSGGYPGKIIGTTVYLDSSWLANNPVYFDAVLIHEMAHVAQNYPWYRWLSVPDYWREGIADFVIYKFGLTNGWMAAQCGAEYPHYTSKYRCPGAFLLFIEMDHGLHAIKELNTRLREGTYSEVLFEETTGKDLEVLWDEFQSTDAFSAIADQVNEMYKMLGVENGRESRRVLKKFENYLARRYPEDQLSALRDELGYKNGKAPADVIKRYAIHKYFASSEKGVQTGEAAEFLRNLGKVGGAPGWSQGLRFKHLWAPARESAVFPIERTFYGWEPGAISLVHYTVVKSSPDADWSLARAWRTGTNGRKVEEFPVP